MTVPDHMLKPSEYLFHQTRHPHMLRVLHTRAGTGLSPQVLPIHTKTEEADIHPSLAGDLSPHRRKSTLMKVFRCGPLREFSARD